MGAQVSRKSEGKHKKKERGKSPHDEERPPPADKLIIPRVTLRTSPLEQREIPLTDFFVIEMRNGEDPVVASRARLIARSKGPQPVGHTEVINGVTVRWHMRNPNGIPVEFNGPHLGGDPGPVKEFKFDKIAAAAGNTPPVRPLPPQVAPPREEPI